MSLEEETMSAIFYWNLLKIIRQSSEISKIAVFLQTGVSRTFQRLFTFTPLNLVLMNEHEPFDTAFLASETIFSKRCELQNSANNRFFKK